MELKARFNEKLSKLLFIEIKAGTKVGNHVVTRNIYMPIKANEVAEGVKQGNDFEKIPLKYLIEGMFYVLGADPNFRYNEDYKGILKSLPEAVNFIKGRILNLVKENELEEGYIFLKGLISIERTKETLDKAYLILENLRSINKEFQDEELELIDLGKEIDNYPMPFLYESLILKDEKDFKGALHSLNMYISLGGEESTDVIEFKENLKNINDYDKAKILVNEAPREALDYLIPLSEYFSDSAEVFYYIAVAYRNLDNFEKAIYYLNEASSIDDSLIEVINEYGINYASLQDFDRAAMYFKKAFEATKSVEICTNIVMCYLNSGNKKEAKEYMEKALEIDAEDEIVKELQKYIN